MMHVDKHVVKMALETTQLLFGVWHVVDPDNHMYTPVYRLTHKNHPCAKWARESVANYTWLCELGLALCREYSYRYKGRTHKCEAYLFDLRSNIPPLATHIGFTPVAQAMPNKHRSDNAIAAYRRYYIENKSHIHNWDHR